MNDAHRIKRIKDAGERIQQLVKDLPGGFKDDETLRQIEALVNEAIAASDGDSGISVIAANIKRYAVMLYSARKHKEHGDGTVRSWLIGQAIQLARGPLSLPDQGQGFIEE